MTRGRIIAVVVLTVTVGGYVYAQPKSAGVTFSPDRAGASYQNYLGDDAFWNMDVAVDYGNCVLGQGRTPGIRAAVGYNFIVWKAVSGRGESRIYAGPGATVGFENSDITITKAPGSLVEMPANSNLNDLVRALNSIGVAPVDLISILKDEGLPMLQILRFASKRFSGF